MAGETAPTGDRLPGLHALRFFAAFAVFVTHEVFFVVGRWVPSMGPVAGYLAHGVQLFFILSAFSLMHSTRVYAWTPGWKSQFYLKRFWRIAPLFYLMLIAAGLFSYYEFGHTTTPFEVVLNVLFINNLFPDYTSSIAFAGWSVSVEMMFYAIFPLAFIYIRTLKSAVILTLVVVFISQSSRILLDQIPQPLRAVYGDWSILVQLQYFALGILAFLAYERLKAANFGAPAPLSSTFLRHALFAAPIAVVVALLVLFEPQLKAFLRFDLTLLGIVFAILTVWFAVLRIPGVSWAPLQHLGEWSYSIYLLHTFFVFKMTPVTTYIFNTLQPFIGPWALAPTLIITFIPVAFAAGASYALIERPGMELGKRLRRRLKARAQRAAEAA